jgi:hypothetical protein
MSFWGKSRFCQHVATNICGQLSSILLQFCFGLALPLLVGTICLDGAEGCGTTDRGVLDG